MCLYKLPTTQVTCSLTCQVSLYKLPTTQVTCSLTCHRCASTSYLQHRSPAASPVRCPSTGYLQHRSPAASPVRCPSTSYLQHRSPAASPVTGVPLQATYNTGHLQPHLSGVPLQATYNTGHLQPHLWLVCLCSSSRVAARRNCRCMRETSSLGLQWCRLLCSALLPSLREAPGTSSRLALTPSTSPRSKQDMALWTGKYHGHTGVHNNINNNNDHHLIEGGSRHQLQTGPHPLHIPQVKAGHGSVDR